MSSPTAARDRLCFPLDYPSLSEALEAAEALRPHVGVFKVGLELFVEAGPPAVEAIKGLQRAVFLDLKLHDIPKTVERAVARAASLDVDFLTVHATGGPRMLASANAAASSKSRLRLLAVTLLTSLSQQDVGQIGFSDSVSSHALGLARLAESAGVSGLVCSIDELTKLRSALSTKPFCVTPGIRPLGAERGDQARVGTPTQAIEMGSQLLVVGRPIKDAADPVAAASSIAAEIEQALQRVEPR